MADPELRLLLIDDDEDDYIIVRGLMERSQHKKFHLDWAPSFEQGLEMLKEQDYGVVLLDFFLGEKTGLDVLQSIEEMDAPVPVILLTGAGNYEIDRSVMEKGAADYLDKNELDSGTLERAIRYALIRGEEMQQLHEQSVRDPLTGLYNRRGLHLLADQQAKLAKRSQSDLLLLIIDLDKFKQINDKQGHVVGDNYLRAFAQILNNTFRESDLLTRFGGDEFAVLATENAGLHKDLLLARLNEQVRAFNAQRAADMPAMDFSVGAARLTPDMHFNLDDLIAQADERMYAHKQGKQKG